MNKQPVVRRIKYQEELNPAFGQSIAEAAGGEALYRCIQCGTCSSTCPVSIYMDFTPRKIIAMTRAGFEEEVLRSNTIWLCVSCYGCTVDCPKDIHITDVMYALKRRAIETGVAPRHFPVPVLAQEFFRSVFRNGRLNESMVITLTFLKTKPLSLLSNAVLGLKLFLKGRMEIKGQSLGKKTAQVRKLLQLVSAK